MTQSRKKKNFNNNYTKNQAEPFTRSIASPTKTRNFPRSLALGERMQTLTTNRNAEKKRKVVTQKEHRKIERILPIK
jgi:hypothetical protein